MSGGESLRRSPGRFFGAGLRTFQARFLDRETVWAPEGQVGSSRSAPGRFGGCPVFRVDVEWTKRKWVILTLKSNREHMKNLDKEFDKVFERSCGTRNTLNG